MITTFREISGFPSGVATLATHPTFLLRRNDSLNPKQKAKEYKATAKDLKSKDPVVKLAAAAKLKDPRYLIEGKCLTNFLLSIVAKKKTIDYVVD
eukprot:gene35942-43593_t